MSSLPRCLFAWLLRMTQNMYVTCNGPHVTVFFGTQAATDANRRTRSTLRSTNRCRTLGNTICLYPTFRCRTIEKTRQFHSIEVPQVPFRDKHTLDVLVLIQRQAPLMHKTVDVPHIRYNAMIVDVPVVLQRQVPTIQTVKVGKTAEYSTATY